MDNQLLALCGLNFFIALIGALAYASKIAGVRAKNIAIAATFSNILLLGSRTANALLGPLLAKRIEGALATGTVDSLLIDFRWLLGAASVAAIVGAIAIPSVQRIFYFAIVRFRETRSMLGLLSGVRELEWGDVLAVIRAPAPSNLTRIRIDAGLPLRIVTLHVFAIALIHCGVLAALYAGCLNPELRLTASSLSAVINGFATIMTFVLIDPYLALLTEEVLKGNLKEAVYRRVITWLAVSNFCGTLLAQIILVPAAIAISAIATWI